MAKSERLTCDLTTEQRRSRRARSCRATLGRARCSSESIQPIPTCRCRHQTRIGCCPTPRKSSSTAGSRRGLITNRIGPSSRRCGPSSPRCGRLLGCETTLTVSSFLRSRPRGSRPLPRPSGPCSSGAFIPTWSACHRHRRRSMPLSPIPIRRPMKNLSIACSPHRITASGWPSRGSMPPGMPTPTAFSRTAIPGSGSGATGWSRRSTPICHSTSSRSSSSRAICCRTRRSSRRSPAASTAITC